MVPCWAAGQVHLVCTQAEARAPSSSRYPGQAAGPFPSDSLLTHRRSLDAAHHLLPKAPQMLSK